MGTPQLENGTRIMVVRLTAKTGLPSFDQIVTTALKEARVVTQAAPFVSQAFAVIEVKHIWSPAQYAAVQGVVARSRVAE